MRLPFLFVLIAASSAAAAMVADSAATDPDDTSIRVMDGLIGRWQCNGVFPASGRTISSTMRFESDLDGAALLKHHDDTSPPARYHALEAWGYEARSRRFNAMLLDSSGGARRFSTDGWVGDTLTWISSPELQPAQRFVYVRKGQGMLQVDWQVMRDGQFVVGDTLTCKRQ
jgi:hypothetical protein